MGFGTFGSTLNDELNRLANGGTYRDMNQMVDDALAAKQWANRENIVPYSTDTVGVLNEIAALGPNRQNWFDFNGVCNYLAGTTGLPAAAALRQITTTGDILTSLAAFYTDAATPRYNYPGFIYLPGIAGQYISTPDAALLDVTGDLDIRVQVALDSWTSTVETKTLLSKDNLSAGTRSYSLDINTIGSGSGLILTWTTDGSTGTRSVKNSTVAIPFTAGTTGWVRAALDVNNGASGNTVTFYTSTDGTTWTTLGTPVVTAGTTSVYAGTAEVQIGAVANQQLPAGKFYRAQIFASIDGTDKRLDVDLTTNITSATYDQFTATTGQLCTINGQNTLTNAGNGGSLLPVTVGSSLAADSNDPKFLAHDGTNYVYLPGVTGNYLSTPDAAALDITGDIDLRAYVALDDWTASTNQTLIAKFNAGAGNFSYRLTVQTDGTLLLQLSPNGTTGSIVATISSVALTIADGTPLWVRATYRTSDNRVQFFTSTNGTSWTQLGTDLTNTAGSIFSSISPVEIGSTSTGAQTLAGKIYRAQILNGIGGTTVLDVDTSVITTGSATSFTAVTGQTVTINRSTSGRKTVAVTQPTWLFGTDDYMEVNNRYMAHSGSNYLYLPGVTSNSASAPDSVPLSITGDLDVRVKVAMDDWTPSSNSVFIGKGSSWYLYLVLTTGRLFLTHSADGTTFINKQSTASPTVTDGSTLWVRVVLDVNNGAGGNDALFYTSPDGLTWTQLGTTVTTAGTTSLFDSTSGMEVGQIQGSLPARGKFFRAQVLNGIGGTVAFDANFENSITSLNQATFTESSTNAATVTINRNGSAYRSAGVIDAGYLYPGATNTFAASATDLLNFGATDSATVLVFTRQWSTPANFGRTLSKEGSNNTASGYLIQNYGTGLSYTATINSVSSTSAGVGTPTYITGNATLVGFTLDRTAQTLVRYMNTTGTSVSTAGVGSLSSISPLDIGRNALSGGGATDMEFIAAAVFRTVLTPAQIRQVTNYFANREVYL